MSQTLITHNLGVPFLAVQRELKKAQEAYWQGDISQSELEAVGSELRLAHWKLQADAGLDLISTGDFAWHDPVLTLSATLGNIPLRHRKSHILGNENERATHTENTSACTNVDLDTLFRVARDSVHKGTVTNVPGTAKWFDTDYHYLVPEFHPNQEFKLSWTQIIDETAQAIALGHKVKPVILGPLSYLWLGKEKIENFDRFDLLENLLPAYQQLLQGLVDTGATWVQIDEPILVLELPTKWRQAFERVYHTIKHPQLKIILATYFGSLGENLTTTINLPIAGLHIDAVQTPEQVLTVIDRLAAHKILSIGIVDGGNISHNDLQKSLDLLRTSQTRLDDRLWIAPSSPLLPSLASLNHEEKLDSDIKTGLAFAQQKVAEVVRLKALLIHTAQETQQNCVKRNPKELANA